MVANEQAGRQLSSKQKIFSFLLCLVSAAILLQTLYFKFTGTEESVYVFTKLGMEPWGRYGSGALEFIVGVMLLFLRTNVVASLLCVGLMLGAVFGHIAVLGIAVMAAGMSDHGLLFYLAVTAMFSALANLLLRRQDVKDTLMFVTRLFIGKQ